MTQTSEYRYLFADLLTNQILTELPLAGVSFDRELNTAGSLSGHLIISDVREDDYEIINSTIPARTAIYVDRNNQIVWGGVLWSRSYDSQTQTLSFVATEFESYFQHRRITTTQTFNNIDQLTVAQSIINTVQGATNGNIGVIVGTETSGVFVTKTIVSTEVKPCLEFIYELSRATNGFDFNIDCSYGSFNSPTKTLRLQYPRRGKIYSASDPTSLVLEFPGTLVSYSYPEDGSRIANSMYGIGTAPTVVNQQNASQLSLGWALLEDSVSYVDYADTTLLNNLTTGALNAVVNPVTIMTVTLPAYSDDFVFGTYDTGDDVRIRITDVRFPNTLDTVLRISKISVDVGDNGMDLVKLTLIKKP